MLRENKGVSLMTAVMTVLLIIIILSTISYTAVKNTKVKDINRLYGDLRSITDEVQLYYAKHNKLPIVSDFAYRVTENNVIKEENGIIKEYSYINDAKLDFILEEDKTMFSKENLYNPNDFDDSGEPGKAIYYQIDLSKFDNLTLNNNGTYLVNEKSKTVYYYDGLKIDNETYHKLPLDYIDAEVPVIEEPEE